MNEYTLNINYRNMMGDTPLIISIKENNFDKFIEILNNKYTDINLVNKFGNFPLHHAVKRKQVKMVKILLEYPNIDVNTYNTFGVAPLHYAVRENSLLSVKYLLKHKKIKPFIAEKNTYKTPFDIALENQRYKIIRAYYEILPLPPMIVLDNIVNF